MPAAKYTRKSLSAILCDLSDPARHAAHVYVLYASRGQERTYSATASVQKTTLSARRYRSPSRVRASEQCVNTGGIGSPWNPIAGAT